ncbi:MAG: hypothetical protein RIQ53_1375 [Pseudomonadota bacterium]
MADIKWGELGKQLLQVGGAYLQQQAREALARDPRLKPLLDALDRPADGRSAAAAPVPAVPPGASAAVSAAASAEAADADADAVAVTHQAFLADAQRFERWWLLPEAAREAAVEDHLRTLDEAGLRQWRQHLMTMQGHVRTATEQHHRNESRSGGGSVEDRISYLDASLRSGQRDPAWLARQQELEGLAQCLAALLERPSATPPAAPAAPVASVASVAPTPPAAPAEPSPHRLMLDRLRTELRQAVDSGQLQPERRLACQQMLDQVEAVVIASERGTLSPEQSLAQMRDLLAEFAPFLSAPGPAQRVRGARARQVDRHAGALKVAAAQALVHCSEGPEQLRLQAVVADATQVQQALAEAADDSAVCSLEQTLLRPAARRWASSQMARHALLARPLWDSAGLPASANSVFFSGADDAQAWLATVLAPLGLQLCPTEALQSQGQARWNALTRAHVAVFDLRGAGAMAQRATAEPARARALATAAYELGLAFALGQPVVVLAEADEALPFDVDLAPCRLQGPAPADAARLTEALDEALYTLQRPTQRPILAASLARLRMLAETQGLADTAEAMGWLDPQRARDAAAFGAAAQAVLQRLPEPGWRLLHSAWPGRYPDPRTPLCFHVMPFGPAWADGARDAARQACEQDLSALGLHYLRGDASENGRIIHAIWDDLCRAHAVLVDLSGANLNVMIELGLAHALGRPVLMVQRRDAPAGLVPPSLDKLRLLTYEDDDALRRLVAQRLPGLLQAT